MSEEEKENIRLEMERKARSLDEEKEESHKDKMLLLKDKEENIKKNSYKGKDIL